MKTKLMIVTLGAAMVAAAGAQQLSADQKAKVEATLKQVQTWAADPSIVAAVKAYNSAPPAEAREMTNEKWSSRTVLDPMVKALSTNPTAQSLKAKRDATVTEAFVSGADGGKVGFTNKPTNWSHRGKEKHMQPMAGKTYIGPVEVDASTGVQQVQVAAPVLDGGKPIGSLVVGLALSKL